MKFTTTTTLLAATTAGVLDVTSAGFTRSCSEFRFRDGGRSVIAKCGSGRSGSQICSEMHFPLCFANDNGKIVPRRNGGFKNVVYCNLNDRTGKGHCLAYNNAEKSAWNEFNPMPCADVGIANTEGYLTCFDHQATL